jgi:hypothetical protein
MTQPQQARPYSGGAVYTATTYAMVAATAALAALVGVAGALWLRQRQWATDTLSSSSANSGSQGEHADDDGDVHAEDADGAHEEGWVQSRAAVLTTAHVVTWSTNSGSSDGAYDSTHPAIHHPIQAWCACASRYDAGLRTGSVLGRCWEWLESAAAITPTSSFTASHEVQSCLQCRAQSESAAQDHRTVAGKAGRDKVASAPGGDTCLLRRCRTSITTDQHTRRRIASRQRSQRIQRGTGRWMATTPPAVRAEEPSPLHPLHCMPPAECVAVCCLLWHGLQ